MTTQENTPPHPPFKPFKYKDEHLIPMATTLTEAQPAKLLGISPKEVCAFLDLLPVSDDDRGRRLAELMSSNDLFSGDAEAAYQHFCRVFGTPTECAQLEHLYACLVAKSEGAN